MPTHIVIRGPPSAIDGLDHADGRRRIGDGGGGGGMSSEDEEDSSKLEEPHDYSQSRPALTRTKTPIRGVVGLRNTCKHDNVHKKQHDSNKHIHEPPHLQLRDESYLHLSRSDIRASPRLPGYLYMLVASTVMLVSAVKFYAERDSGKILQVRHLQEEVENEGTDAGKTSIYGFLVSTWKLYGAIGFSAAGMAIGLFVLYAHFDTVCFPQTWNRFFRDGSKQELYFLYALFLFWAAGLHICTSTFSVGEAAPNVYFTTWIGFGSVAINIGVWRKGADQQTLADKLWEHPRETMHNWFFVWIFAMIESLAVADVYANRHDKDLLLNGEVQNIPQDQWNRALCVSFGAMFISALTMVFDKYFIEPLRFHVCCSKCQMNLDWRQIEGVIALGFVGLYSWIIIEYTGVNFPLNGPSNAYFGSWGVFFASILTFGTWLKENKHVELFLKDDEEEEGDKQEEQAPPESSK